MIFYLQYHQTVSQIPYKLNVTNLMLRWKAPCALIAVDSEAALPRYPNQAWVGAGWWSWWQLVATERRAANSAINAGALVFTSSMEAFAILVDPSIVLTCASLRFCWKDTYYSLLLTSSTPTVTQDTKKIPQDKWDQKVSGYKEAGRVRPPRLVGMEEPAIHSLWGSTGMVQKERVFLSLKPPVAVIKHLLLIKMSPAVQGSMFLNHKPKKASLMTFVAPFWLFFYTQYINYIFLYFNTSDVAFPPPPLRFLPSQHSLFSHLGICPRPWSRHCHNYTPALCGGRKASQGCNLG